jgi:hypothetical protein
MIALPDNISLFQPLTPAPVRGVHLQGCLSAFFDLDAVGKDGEGAAETGAEGPVVEVAEVGFEGGVDEPLVFFFGEGTKGVGCAWSDRMRCCWSGGRSGVDVCRVG